MTEEIENACPRCGKDLDWGKCTNGACEVGEPPIHKCSACGKEHTHSHIGFADGAEHFDQCKECCKVCIYYAKKKEKQEMKNGTVSY